MKKRLLLLIVSIMTIDAVVAGPLSKLFDPHNMRNQNFHTSQTRWEAYQSFDPKVQSIGLLSKKTGYIITKNSSSKGKSTTIKITAHGFMLPSVLYEIEETSATQTELSGNGMQGYEYSFKSPKSTYCLAWPAKAALMGAVGTSLIGALYYYFNALQKK